MRGFFVVLLWAIFVRLSFSISSPPGYKRFLRYVQNDKQNAAPGFSPKRGCPSEDEYVSAKAGKFNCIYKYRHYRK
jgi:hypothetical protein